MAETGGTGVPRETGSTPYGGGTPTKWPVKSGKEESQSKKAAKIRMAKQRNHGKTGGVKAPGEVQHIAAKPFKPTDQNPTAKAASMRTKNRAFGPQPGSGGRLVRAGSHPWAQ